MKSLAACFVLAAASWATAGTNLYPDPSFEQTGDPGPARTGPKAGHLKVGAAQHWAAIGGKLAVEPFATYRARAYVRVSALPAKGTLYGLYAYSWNSFDWRWAQSVSLGATPEWALIEVAFVSPNDYVYLHPLAATDAANAEAWVDDIEVEKILSPEETMKTLLARPLLSEQDVELRVRYCLSKGKFDEAKTLAAASTDYVKADLACLLGEHLASVPARLRQAAELVRYGGLGYHNGDVRFRELTVGARPDELLGVLREALDASGFGAAATRAYAMTLARQLDDAARYGSCRQAEDQVSQIETQLGALLKQCPSYAPGRKELDAMPAKVKSARDAVAKRRTDLGQCVIRIGGKALDPATHAIVIPDRPTPQEDFAARDLGGHIERLTGKDLPIIAESKLAGQTPIVVGKCLATHKKLGVEADFAKLGLEGIAIASRGPALVLAGNQRGVLYAVYQFLEDYCNCRWFTPDCTVIPKSGTFDIPALSVLYVPPLEYRSTDYPCSRDGDWAVRNRMNGTQTQVDERRGGKIDYSHFVHTFNSILDPAQHFATHPEYFSEINGKRVGGNTQLCLTNPEVLGLAKKAVRRWIEEAPTATIFSVSQNDWHNACQCPTCKALAEKEGSECGPLLHFVNAIADDIAKDFPDKVIDTLAYQYTRKPPKEVKPRPNVCVRLCSIECCFAHPLDSTAAILAAASGTQPGGADASKMLAVRGCVSPENKAFVRDIQEWHKFCNRLYIWDYVINYSHSIMPFPNLYSLKPNIRFFIANGVKGIYEEACYFTKGSELAELRTYIMAKTLWNPDCDTDKAIDEFAAGYYGPAAKPIRGYIDLMHKQVADHPDWHAHIFDSPNAPHLRADVIEKASALFDEAEKAVADSPTLLHRVQVARLPVLYVQIVTSRQGFKEEGDTLVDTTNAGETGRVELFEKIARKEGLTMVREHAGSGALDVWVKTVAVANRKLPIVRLKNDALEVAILPGLGGRIWKMTHKPTGREILQVAKDHEGGFVPDMGGYEEYSEGEYRSPGWNEAYRVVAKTANSITMEAKLRNQLLLKRTITLDPQKPLVTIESTLTNAGKDPRQACLRAHPSFAVSDVAKATALLRRNVARPAGAESRPDKTWAKTPLALPADAAEKDEFLSGDALPAGEWAIIDSLADLAIVSRFDPAEVGQCLLNRAARDNRVNLELYSKQAQLAPGQSLSLKHTIEIVPGAAKALP